MEGIPVELIFVLIFIVFSVLEAVGRKKGAQRRGGPGHSPDPGTGERPGREEPSRSGRPASPSRTQDRGEEAGARSSEGLVPEDVWEEILGLARGTPTRAEQTHRADTTPEGRELPSPEGESLEEIPPFEVRSLESIEARPEPDRRIPDRSRAGDRDRKRDRKVEVPPVPRSKVRGMPAVAAGEIGSGEGIAAPSRRKPKGGRVRQEVFGDGSLKELRKAVILREVLGKPVGMKE
ncbi:MAG: hypothetical protein R6T96_15700 [Longimicrobiales bacterium]